MGEESSQARKEAMGLQLLFAARLARTRAMLVGKCLLVAIAQTRVLGE